jgi:hypothetical protein
VVDTRNATKDLHEYKDRIIKLGPEIMSRRWLAMMTNMKFP